MDISNGESVWNNIVEIFTKNKAEREKNKSKNVKRQKKEAKKEKEKQARKDRNKLTKRKAK